MTRPRQTELTLRVDRTNKHEETAELGCKFIMMYDIIVIKISYMLGIKH